MREFENLGVEIENKEKPFYAPPKKLQPRRPLPFIPMIPLRRRTLRRQVLRPRPTRDPLRRVA